MNKAGESEGHSGAFFFFSHDKKLLIKTMTQEDFNGFKRMFRDYFRHICSNPDSLLARIYGIYSIEITGFDTVHMLIMSNGIQFDINMERKLSTYDLKGSMEGRYETDLKSIQKDKNFKEQLKDKNWMELNFNENEIKRIIQILDSDSDLMAKYDLMDYSLLFQINRLAKGVELDKYEEGMNVKWERKSRQTDKINGRHVFTGERKDADI